MIKFLGAYGTLIHRVYATFLCSLSFLFFSIVLSGCLPIPGKGGTKHYVIIGFGVVSVNQSEDAATATQAHSLGVSISDRPGLKLGIGYSSSTVVTVAPGAEDVRIEVSKTPGGPLVVDTHRAKFIQPGVKGDDHE